MYIENLIREYTNLLFIETFLFSPDHTPKGKAVEARKRKSDIGTKSDPSPSKKTKKKEKENEKKKKKNDSISSSEKEETDSSSATRSPEKRATRDDSFKEFQRVCNDVAKVDAYTEKTAVMKSLFSKGSEAGEFNFSNGKLINRTKITLSLLNS